MLDHHHRIADQLGFMVKKSPEHPSFWTAPGFKAYWEQWRLSEEAKKADPNANFQTVTSKEVLCQWIRTVKSDLELDEIFVVLEQGAYRLYGDYRPLDTLGGCEGFRALVDQFRAEDVHFCYYIHPSICNTKVAFFQKHPEAFCKPKDKGHRTKYPLEFGDDQPEYALVDWTHPMGRQFILDQVEMLLSDKHAIHPYLYSRPLAEKDFRRRRAGVKVQANAPINITDQIHIDPDTDRVCIWRKRTQGPLANWYASLAFGKRCFATYSETEARITASETRNIELPLPAGVTVQAVE